MDTKKFGLFVAELRKGKGMTQVELADKLQVTDKAVSRWERGIGFPDIEMLEPLSDALGVTVLELLKSEHIPQKEISIEGASQAFIDTIDVAKTQVKMWKQIMTAAAWIVAMILLSQFIPYLFGFNLPLIIPVILGVIILAVVVFILQKKRTTSFQVKEEHE